MTWNENIKHMVEFEALHEGDGKRRWKTQKHVHYLQPRLLGVI